jgi:hypothetical protein
MSFVWTAPLWQSNKGHQSFVKTPDAEGTKKDGIIGELFAADS